MIIRKATELEAIQEYDLEMQACFRTYEMENDTDDDGNLVIPQH